MNQIEKALQTKVACWLRQKGCVVIKMPAGYASIPVGFPDLLVLIDGGGFAALEIKASEKAKFQALQKEWLAKLDGMYYARVINPTNWPDVKKELEDMI